MSSITPRCAETRTFSRESAACKCGSFLDFGVDCQTGQLLESCSKCGYQELVRRVYPARGSKPFAARGYTERKKRDDIMCADCKGWIKARGAGPNPLRCNPCRDAHRKSLSRTWHQTHERKLIAKERVA